MSAIEALQLDAAYVAVAKSLGLPCQSYMALSDGPILDAQAGAETFGSALIAALAGVNSVSGPGLLDFLLVFSLPKLVFDNDSVAIIDGATTGPSTGKSVVVLFGATRVPAQASNQP
jgi:trimethylamine:corrinoid methyltransferase-like protein